MEKRPDKSSLSCEKPQALNGKLTTMSIASLQDLGRAAYYRYWLKNRDFCTGDSCEAEYEAHSASFDHQLGHS
jgi:hypothetical protein